MLSVMRISQENKIIGFSLQPIHKQSLENHTFCCDSRDSGLSRNIISGSWGFQLGETRRIRERADISIRDVIYFGMNTGTSIRCNMSSVFYVLLSINMTFTYPGNVIPVLA
jgi:hypothetical protein